jgi:hypothetical protein
MRSFSRNLDPDIGHEEGGEEELRIYNRRETRRK